MDTNKTINTGDLLTSTATAPTPEMMHIFTIVSIVIVILIVISLILKGFSLWYSARNGQKYWFIAMLIINTLGLLEIIYLIFYRKNKIPENKSDVNTNK